ncbi:electron transfer flavoprotein, beta subunit [Desulfitobacterium dichloroeliminans LMG P-21439]|uniref:Electron transfer flavoprotein small subunit n=1 Tax=Desulfitobacterium dichloroeliminans (strain LMG P-21439 / DCA1) TaxID=871963 RepID=L0F683_DESDL|nr:electron transfer flavoprotein subunit beta/FixA family protein [Desulfitobacterium dichloroeliminans]AGA69349.1 electron transfer flavoprotein, beta subunit [Desulfitobacterium dichloroeliminans LMG P-21439]
MHFVVCLKQVPDSSEVRIDPKTNTLMREGVPSIINPYDAHALEEAIRLKEKVGGKVTIVTMGPPQAKEALRKAMSFGADRAILLTDRAFGGSDSLATAYIITQAILKIHETDPVDLVLAGKEAIDGDTAQTGPGIATRLGFPQLTYVIKVTDITSDTITVHRKLETGREVVQAKLPALLTVEKELNELRYASLPNMMNAAAYEPEIVTANSFEFDVTQMGLKGSPTSVNKIFAPPARSGGEKLDGTKDPKGVAAQLVEKVFQENIVMVSPDAKGGNR